jgi:hypothetical protein
MATAQIPALTEVYCVLRPVDLDRLRLIQFSLQPYSHHDCWAEKTQGHGTHVAKLRLPPSRESELNVPSCGHHLL